MTMIPMVDLKAQYRSLKPEIDAAIASVIENAQFVLGPAVESFERDFAAYCGTSDAIGTNSGTSALHLALLAAGVGPGDEVITTPFTFVATVATIEYAGARPVLADIEPDYCTIDPAAVERAITPWTRAIVPVHLFGHPADMDPIMAIAKRHGLVVIEDACQAHGAEYKGRRVGSIGDIGCFSFYPGKSLGAYGEGGAAVTSNPRYGETIRRLRAWGQGRRYEHLLKGFNYRMEGIQGAILGVKLKHLETWIAARRRHAATYVRLLEGTGVRTPGERRQARHTFTVYTVRVTHRDAWRSRLGDSGIQTAVHYPVPVHLQPAYRNLGRGPGDFPVAEAAAGDVLSLPLFPEMTDSQIEEVTGVLRAGLPVTAGSANA